MSTQQPIHQVLAAVMQDVGAVAKKDRNAAQGFNFRGVDAVVNAVAPALRKHGVLVVPHAIDVRHRDITTANGKAARECIVLATYRFWGPAGDHLDIQAPGESMDMGDKSCPKAMSVAFRTALLQALCLPTDEADPDHDTYERGAAPKDDEAETIRGQIRNFATAKQIPLRQVMSDFEARTQENIRDASVPILLGYLNDIKANGIRQEAACS